MPTPGTGGARVDKAGRASGSMVLPSPPEWEASKKCLSPDAHSRSAPGKPHFMKLQPKTYTLSFIHTYVLPKKEEESHIMNSYKEYTY